MAPHFPFPAWNNPCHPPRWDIPWCDIPWWDIPSPLWCSPPDWYFFIRLCLHLSVIKADPSSSVLIAVFVRFAGQTEEKMGFAWMFVLGEEAHKPPRAAQQGFKHHQTLFGHSFRPSARCHFASLCCPAHRGGQGQIHPSRLLQDSCSCRCLGVLCGWEVWTDRWTEPQNLRATLTHAVGVWNS